MKLYLLTICTFFILSSCSTTKPKANQQQSKAFTPVFEQFYSEQTITSANKIIKHPDNHLLIIGFTRAPGQEDKLFLLEVDYNGKELNRVTVPVYDVAITQAFFTKDNQLILSGTNYDSESVLLHFNQNNELLLSKTFQNAQEFTEVLKQLATTLPDSYFYNSDLHQVYTIKDGQLASNTSLAEYQNEEASILTRHNNGEYTIAGFKSSTKYRETDIEVTRISNDGEVLWSKTYDYSKLDNVYSMLPLDNGGVLIGGSKVNNEQSNSYNNYWLLQLDKNGVEQWEQLYPSRLNSTISTMQKVGDNIIIAGSHEVMEGNDFDTFRSVDLTLLVDEQGTILQELEGLPNEEFNLFCNSSVVIGNSLFLLGNTDYYLDNKHQNDQQTIQLKRIDF